MKQLAVKVRLVFNHKEIDKDFLVLPNENIDQQALERAAIYFYGVVHEFRSWGKISDRLVMSVFNSIDNIVMNYVYDGKIEQLIDLRKVDTVDPVLINSVYRRK